jgi:hypothetical protein
MKSLAQYRTAIQKGGELYSPILDSYLKKKNVTMSYIMRLNLITFIKNYSPQGTIQLTVLQGTVVDYKFI